MVSEGSSEKEHLPTVWTTRRREGAEGTGAKGEC